LDFFFIVDEKYMFFNRLSNRSFNELSCRNICGKFCLIDHLMNYLVEIFVVNSLIIRIKL